MKASNWQAMEKGALLGFFDLTLPSGLKLIGCTLYEKDERMWVSLPSKPEIDREGHCKIGDNGKRIYRDMVEIVDKGRREQFQAGALAAVAEIRKRQARGHDHGG